MTKRIRARVRELYVGASIRYLGTTFQVVTIMPGEYITSLFIRTADGPVVHVALRPRQKVEVIP